MNTTVPRTPAILTSLGPGYNARGGQFLDLHFALEQSRSGKSIALGLVLPSFLLWTSMVSGAVIYSQGQINAESDVLNAGTQVVATDLGNLAPAVTVNGVSFGADSATGLTGFVPGDPGDFSTNFLSGSPLDNLLSELDFQNLSLGNSSLTLSGLTTGQHYLLQLFLCNELNSTAKSSRVSIQGQAYNIANFGNNADYIRADFIASQSTEVVLFGNGSNNESDRIILNAFALSQVPEPGSLAILALGLACFAASRRKPTHGFAGTGCRTC